MKTANRLLWTFLLLLAVLPTKATMYYSLSFDPAKHYIHVELNMKELPAGDLTMVLPVWAPGYYNLAFFPKNITDFCPMKSDGTKLKWTKEGATRWIVDKGSASDVKLTYRVYSNFINVCEAMVDSTHAFVPLSGICMYRLGQVKESVDLTVTPFPAWKEITTAMDIVSSTAPYKLKAPDFDVLYDSPILLGNQHIADFDLDGHGYQVVTPQGAPVDERVIPSLKKMIAATTKMFGETPYKDYKFMWLGKGMGGLEHAACQADYSGLDFTFKDSTEFLDFFSFVSHEFFHLYNIKRIRPIELGPFDYEHAVYTPSLWISEGFTNLYSDYDLVRAGIADGDFLLSQLSGHIKGIEGKEGHKHFTLRQSSYDAWLYFYDSPEDTSDRMFSFYLKGPIVGFLMDIYIRHESNNSRSLDDVMRALYNKYYKQLQRGFTEEEAWQVINETAGCDMSEFRRYVETTDEIDYSRLLGYAGLKLDGFTVEKQSKCDPLAAKIRASLLGK